MWSGSVINVIAKHIALDIENHPNYIYFGKRGTA